MISKEQRTVGTVPDSRGLIVLLSFLIMEICKAPSLRLKAQNKHSITHIMYIEMERLSAIKMYYKKLEKANA